VSVIAQDEFIIAGKSSPWADIKFNFNIEITDEKEYKYRLAMANLWRTFHPDGKFSPAW
jgi:hypothetical protein